MAKMIDTPQCGQKCPVRRALRVFEGKYSASILRELLSGDRRFSQLLKNIPGISSKTLNEKLKEYIDSGIVTRHAYPEVPPKVEYRISERGAQLEQVVNELHRFGLEDERRATMARKTAENSSEELRYSAD